MLCRYRSQRCIIQNHCNIYQNVKYFSDAQPQPWNIHPTPNPYDHAQRYAKHKGYASPPDPKPYKTTEPYIDTNKAHLPRYPRTQIEKRKQQQYLAQPSPLLKEDSTILSSTLSLQRMSESGKYLASNKQNQEVSGLLTPSYMIDAKKRKSFGIVDDETSYKGIRKKLEMIIREAKSPELQRKGLNGILSISRKFQRLLDQAELLETPKYAFPLFDEIFFALQKYGIMSDRPYNQMIVQCERREMNSRWYDHHIIIFLFGIFCKFLIFINVLLFL